MLPSRLITYSLGEAEFQEINGEEVVVRLRKTFRLADTELNNWEIKMSELNAMEVGSKNDEHSKTSPKNYFKEHNLTLSIKLFETDDEIVKN